MAQFYFLNGSKELTLINLMQAMSSAEDNLWMEERKRCNELFNMVSNIKYPSFDIKMIPSENFSKDEIDIHHKFMEKEIFYQEFIQGNDVRCNKLLTSSGVNLQCPSTYYFSQHTEYNNNNSSTELVKTSYNIKNYFKDTAIDFLLN